MNKTLEQLNADLVALDAKINEIAFSAKKRDETTVKNFADGLRLDRECYREKYREIKVSEPGALEKLSGLQEIESYIISLIGSMERPAKQMFELENKRTELVKRIAIKEKETAPTR